MPAAQLAHKPATEAPDTVEYVPGTHETQATAAAADAYEPGLQLRQAVAPVEGWYVPAAQEAHRFAAAPE